MGDFTPSPTVVPLASSGDSQQQQQQMPYTAGGVVSVDGDPAANAHLQCTGSSSSLEGAAALQHSAGGSKWLLGPLPADERVSTASVPPQPPLPSSPLQSAMHAALGQGIFKTLRALMLRQQSTYVQQLFDLHELSQVQGLLMCEMQQFPEMPFEGDGLSTDRISPPHLTSCPGAQPAD